LLQPLHDSARYEINLLDVKELIADVLRRLNNSA
jgi:hypothetical protein